jgi:hypothetical protein
LGAAHISDVANIEEGHGDGHPASRAATRLISTMPGQPRLRRILPEIWLTASSDSSTWTVRPSNISGATSGRFRAKSRKRYFFFEGKNGACALVNDRKRLQPIANFRWLELRRPDVRANILDLFH